MKLREVRLKMEKAGQVRVADDAQRADNPQMPACGLPAPLPFVHQKPVSVD